MIRATHTVWQPWKERSPESPPTVVRRAPDSLSRAFARLASRLLRHQALDDLSLGRYRLERIVGAGAMGTVLRAWDSNLERPVAIKTLRFDVPDAGERKQLAERLRQEALTLAQFNDPHIVKVYEFRRTADAAFIAMEYIEGVSLEGYADVRRKLTVSECAHIALAIAKGLAVAHDRQVVHHDIKPANILLGREGAIKIGDFGVSERTPGQGRESDHYGTPGFMPPEAIAGRPSGSAGDLFALGVIVYRLLTGVMPFPGRSVEEILAQTIRRQVVPPRHVLADIPSGLSGLVMSLLEKDPERRCPGAAEAARQLAGHVERRAKAWTPASTCFVGGYTAGVTRKLPECRANQRRLASAVQAVA